MFILYVADTTEVEENCNIRLTAVCNIWAQSHNNIELRPLIFIHVKHLCVMLFSAVACAMILPAAVETELSMYLKQQNKLHYDSFASSLRCQL